MEGQAGTEEIIMNNISAFLSHRDDFEMHLLFVVFKNVVTQNMFISFRI